MKTYYTYLYLREDGTPYYVGKGSGRRAFDPSQHRGLTPKDRKFILIQIHENEAEAFAAEIFLISYYGRKDTGAGCLVNLTDGGENPPKTKKGRRITWGAKISETCKRKGILPPSTKGMTFVLTPEARQAIGDRNRAILQTAEVIAKRVATRRARGGYAHTLATRNKISLTCKIKGIMPPNTTGKKLNLSDEERFRRAMQIAKVNAEGRNRHKQTTLKIA